MDKLEFVCFGHVLGHVEELLQRKINYVSYRKYIQTLETYRSDCNYLLKLRVLSVSLGDDLTTTGRYRKTGFITFKSIAAEVDLDPHPHLFEKQDEDWLQSKKPDPDPHRSGKMDTDSLKK